MASTLTNLLIHITFSTRGRAPLISSDLESTLYAFVGGICRRMDSPLLAMGGVADHVHLMISLAKTVAVADLMLNIKRDSSKWMRERAQDFAWQYGYFAFSIGASGAEALRRYIADQKTHHQRIGFQDEVRKFLRKYGVAWDEQYIWT